MLELKVLGTGNATVTRCYNTCFLLHHDDEYFMVDAGGGNQILSILNHLHIDLQEIHHLFVTHSHTDHVLGVVWIIRMIAQKMLLGKYQGQFFIYAHERLQNKIKTICELTLQKKLIQLFDERIVFVSIDNDRQKTICHMDFTFFDILSTKEQQFGFVLQTQKTSLTFLGDEPKSDQLDEKYIKRSDWLLSEAFCLYQDRDVFKPYEKHHSTARDAGLLAQKYDVKHLVLWHTEDRHLETRKQSYTQEAKECYEGEVFVPNDLETILIEK